MSIATLKKKTNAKYNNVSVGYNQFSINGSHRSQGYIGQESLSRSLPITHFRGSVPNRKENIFYGSGIVSLNDPKVVKPTVMNTSGRLANMMNCNPNKCTKKNVSFNTVKYIPPYLDVIQRRKQNCISQKSIVPNSCNTCVNNIADNDVKQAFKYKYMRNIAFTPNDSVTKTVNTPQSSDIVNLQHSECSATDKLYFSGIKQVPFGC